MRAVALEKSEHVVGPPQTLERHHDEVEGTRRALEGELKSIGEPVERFDRSREIRRGIGIARSVHHQEIGLGDVDDHWRRYGSRIEWLVSLLKVEDFGVSHGTCCVKSFVAGRIAATSGAALIGVKQPPGAAAPCRLRPPPAAAARCRAAAPSSAATAASPRAPDSAPARTAPRS